MKKIFVTLIVAVIFSICISIGICAEEVILSGSFGDKQIVDVFLYENPIIFSNGETVNIKALLSSNVNEKYQNEVYVPYESTLKLMGVTYEFNKYANTISASKDDINVTIFLLCDYVYTNTGKKYLDAPCYCINGKHYIPLFSMLEIFGYNHSVNEDTSLHTFSIGEKAGYTLYEKGSLIIDGNEAIPVYQNEAELPWYEYYETIKEIVIEEGITSINGFTFETYENLEAIVIPKSVTTISSTSFNGISSNIKIYGYKDSFVEEHIKDNGLDFHIIGDINEDENIDMNDAILLLQYSMFPDIYSIEYLPSVDFTDDKNIDMNDAILLLQHSMFPDLYPL